MSDEEVRWTPEWFEAAFAEVIQAKRDLDAGRPVRNPVRVGVALIEMQALINGVGMHLDQPAREAAQAEVDALLDAAERLRSEREERW